MNDTQLTACGRVSGYACLFGKLDLGRDRIARGAFARSLAVRGPPAIRMLFQHDPARPIGRWTSVHEDARGLFVTGRIATEAVSAADIAALVRAGALDGLSIGFRTVRASRGPKGTRTIHEIDLHEVSLVTFPMQPAARVLRPPTPLSNA